MLADYPSFDSFDIEQRDGVEIFRPGGQVLPMGGAYLGIDIGSTSTKAVLAGPDGRFAAGFYARTGGDPIGAVQGLLKVMGPVAGLRGVATTGSGRAMIRQVFSADREVNEITAHARAAVFLHPGVDTIIEIGGQDSKFTRIRDGEVFFSTMNYVCAAGTGSFIEEQARRLGVSLAEFSDMALSGTPPFTSDRCTVYMERDLAALLGEGWSREDLAGAVLHSVRDNYLSRVVGRSGLGDTIVFQGATARNRALVSAFEQQLGKTVHVSPFCHLTGALGAALHCRDEGLASSRFIWETRPITLLSEECRLCSNHCSLTVAERNGERTGWGMKCGRDYAHRRAAGKTAAALSDDTSSPEKRFLEAMGPLSASPKAGPPESAGHDAAAAARRSISIGIPRGLYAISYEPLWRRFLLRLGFAVESSEQLKDAVEVGAASVNSDFCAPMILAHGYVKQLLDRGVDYVFAPTITGEREGPSRTGPISGGGKTTAPSATTRSTFPRSWGSSPPSIRAAASSRPSFLSGKRATTRSRASCTRSSARVSRAFPPSRCSRHSRMPRRPSDPRGPRSPAHLRGWRAMRAGPFRQAPNPPPAAPRFACFSSGGRT